MSNYRPLTDIAKDIRTELKQQLPGWKFSVRTKVYSGGGSINVSLMAGPEEVEVGGDGYAQLNHYTFLNDYGYGRERRMSNGAQLTERGFEVLEQAAKALARQHWDKSDSQIDYFHCNYYMHLEIGRWNKPYQVTA